MKKLIELAKGCNAGACNSYALAIALAEALKESGPRGTQTAAYKCVLGQLSYLAGESAGPSGAAWDAFKDEEIADKVV